MQEPQDQDEVDASAAAAAAATPNAKKNTLAIPPFRGVHTQTMNFVEYSTGEKELYDLTVDPFELNNLVSKADPKLLAALSQRVDQGARAHRCWFYHRARRAEGRPQC